MKTLDEINRNLEDFERKFGIAVKGVPQLSPRWFDLKLGVISASNAHRAVAKIDSETRATYMAELVAQVCTGVIEEINAKQLSWGKEHEPAARKFYEFDRGVTLEQVTFVFKDNSFRAGCSPDGVLPNKGAELKCPYDSTNFIKFLVAERIKPEWRWQNQFTMWCCDAEEWDFAQYDPRMKKSLMKTLNIQKDPEAFKVFDDMIPKFVEDMDKMLARAGFTFGEQWTRLAETKASA
ncbi:MAG: YqaJ viral recombinase family protein [Rhodospirillales bacterium]|nr:YqaJ viral recombinase family protein [Rhodospirillales bacterium]